MSCVLVSTDWCSGSLFLVCIFVVVVVVVVVVFRLESRYFLLCGHLLTISLRLFNEFFFSLLVKMATFSAVHSWHVRCPGS